MTSFKRSLVSDYKVSDQRTDENLYWDQYQTSSIISTDAHVRTVSFSPKKPYVVAATTSAKVNFYEACTGDLSRTLTRFKQAAFGGRYRADGALFAVGGAECRVRVFDTLRSTKTPLRVFKGHEGAIHECSFTSSLNHLASFSDDSTVKLWDVAGADNGDPIVTLIGHSDHIRTGTAFNNNPYMVVSGGYDHTVRVWDTRTGTEQIKIMESKPIEKVILFPNDQLLVAAGGTFVTVWDLCTCKSLVKLNNHHKTVTSLFLAKDSSRLLTAGLDKHVKIYDTTSYKVVHSLQFPSPILSIAVSEEGSYMAAGLGGSGLLSILHKQETAESELLPIKKRGPIYVPVDTLTENKELETTVVSDKKEANLPRYDIFLKRFEYNRALNFVLSTYKRKPEVTMTVIRELSRRGALHTVLAGRNGHYLKLLLQFIIDNIDQVRYVRALLGITQLILDLYADRINQLEPKCRTAFVSLSHSFSQQVSIMKSMSVTSGQLQMVMCAAEANRKRKHSSSLENSLS